MAKDNFGKKVLVVIILILILGALYALFFYNPPSKNENINSFTEIIDSAIVYEKEGEIWMANPKDDTKNKLVSGINPLFSPDKKRIAYTVNNSSLNDQGQAFNESEWGIHIYNLETKENKVLFQSSATIPQALRWSTDSRYLAVDPGLAAYNSEKFVLDTEESNEPLKFRVWSNSLDWLSPSEIIYSEPQEVNPKRFYGETGEGEGLTIINLNGETNRLLEATNIKSYRFSQILDKDNLEIITLEVDTPSDWESFEKVRTKYWKTNYQGQNLEEIKDRQSLTNKLKEIIPESYKNYASFYSIKAFPNDKNWVVFVGNKTGNLYDLEEIFVMNLKDVTTLKKIDNGSNPDW